MVWKMGCITYASWCVDRLLYEFVFFLQCQCITIWERHGRSCFTHYITNDMPNFKTISSSLKKGTTLVNIHLPSLYFLTIYITNFAPNFKTIFFFQLGNHTHWYTLVESIPLYTFAIASIWLNRETTLIHTC